jgi:hypothetical protein
LYYYNILIITFIAGISPGEVITICGDVETPSGIAVAANGTILVTSRSGHNILGISKPPGTPPHLPPHPPIPPSPCHPSLSPLPFVHNICLTGCEGYEVVTLAGSGTAGNADGLPAECNFNGPEGIVIDEPTNTCFVMDGESSRIRMIYLI